MRLPRAVWLLPAAAVTAELAGWLLGGDNRDATFAWFRVVNHAGGLGLGLAAGAGILAGVVTPAFPQGGRRASWIALGLAALLLHTLFWDLPQGQPDAVNYFVYAQYFAADPLGTLLDWRALVWDVPQGRFHTYLPLVPLIYGVAFRLLGESTFTADVVMTSFAVALPLTAALLGWALDREREGLTAGWLCLSLPYLQAQSGWLLVDLPLTVFVGLACVAWIRARGKVRWILVAAVALLALGTKISAGLFLAALIGAVALRHRRLAIFCCAAAALVALVVLHPPFLRRIDTYPQTLLSLAIHLRPAWWVLLLPAMCVRGRVEALGTGALLTLPVLLLYAPVEHVVRYALPLAPVLALTAAHRLREVRPLVSALVVSGLVLMVTGYRPALVHHQAANLQLATRQLQDAGVASIEVWGDTPGTTFPTSATAALVDLYATVPVFYGGMLRTAPPGAKRHWWEFYEPPPWHEGGQGEGILLGLYGADAQRFEDGPGRGLRRLGSVDRYRASSWLLPREVILYRRGEVLHRPASTANPEPQDPGPPADREGEFP